MVVPLAFDKGDSKDRTALWWASHRYHDKLVELLLGHQDVDVNQTNKYGQTPLHVACESKSIWDEEVVELLLSHESIQVNRTNNDGQTPMQIAERKGSTDICELLKRGKVAKK